MMKKRKKSFSSKLSLTALLTLVSSITLQASPIKWEIHQAFPSWVEGERWMVFAKLTNVGEEIIPLSGKPVDPAMEQIRLVPQWIQGKTPHSHGHRSHSHHLPQADQPWKSTLDWNDAPLKVLQGISRALKPEQTEVIGDLGLRGLSHGYSMPNPHMESFQLAARLGPDRYALSEPQPLTFANVPTVEKSPIIAEITTENIRPSPIRQIEIDGGKWLFYGFSKTRIARVPEGATPRFSTEDKNQILVIEFEGTEEEPVRIDMRQGFPLSGSKRTVPHLHLWRSLTDRSMLEYAGTEGGFFKESGLTLEQALTLKWDGTDPELKAKTTLPTDKETD